jgi:hypothetical protein
VLKAFRVELVVNVPVAGIGNDVAATCPTAARARRRSEGGIARRKRDGRSRVEVCGICRGERRAELFEPVNAGEHPTALSNVAEPVALSAAC